MRSNDDCVRGTVSVDVFEKQEENGRDYNVKTMTSHPMQDLELTSQH